ncbi:MAG: hypothetical protein R3A11_09980 [Bdellovibrionota bacterium]
MSSKFLYKLCWMIVASLAIFSPQSFANPTDTVEGSESHILEMIEDQLSHEEDALQLWEAFSTKLANQEIESIEVDRNKKCIRVITNHTAYQCKVKILFQPRQHHLQFLCQEIFDIVIPLRVKP